MGIKKLIYSLLAYEIAGLLFYINIISTLWLLANNYGYPLVVVGVILSAAVLGFIFYVVMTFFIKLLHKVSHYYNRYNYPRSMIDQMKRVRRKLGDLSNEKLLETVEKEVSKHYLDEAYFFNVLYRCAIADGISYILFMINAETTGMNILRMVVYALLTYLCFNFSLSNDMNMKERMITLYWKEEVQKKK